MNINKNTNKNTNIQYTTKEAMHAEPSVHILPSIAGALRIYRGSLIALYFDQIYTNIQICKYMHNIRTPCQPSPVLSSFSNFWMIWYSWHCWRICLFAPPMSYNVNYMMRYALRYIMKYITYMRGDIW